MQFPFLHTFAMLCWVWSIPTLHAAHTIHLRGIVDVPELKAALVEVKHEVRIRPTKPPISISTTRFLRMGESFEDNTVKGTLVSIQLIGIDPANETIQLVENGKEVVHHLETPDLASRVLSAGKTGCHFRDVRFQDALNLYSDFRNRTVLIHPGIQRLSVTVQAEGKSATDVAHALEKALRDQGLAMVPDGEKFVLLVPRSMEKWADPSSQRLDATSPIAGSFATDGMVNTIVDAYGRLLGRTQKGASPFAQASIYLYTQPLTQAEMRYAFDRLLEWSGLRVEVVDEKSFRVVPFKRDANP